MLTSIFHVADQGEPQRYIMDSAYRIPSIILRAGVQAISSGFHLSNFYYDLTIRLYEMLIKLSSRNI